MTRSLSIFLGAIIALALLTARAQAAPPAPTQVVFSQVQTSTLSVDFQGLTGTTIQFQVELSSAFANTAFSSDTVLLTSTFTALDINTHYFARVWAIDTVDSSSTTSVTIDTYTLANAPVNLSSTSVTFSGVGLAWDGNGNPSVTVFSIERSSDGITFASVASTTDVTYNDVGITPGVTYEYRVRALNVLNVPTAYTNTITLTTPGTTSVPRTPPGLTAVRTQTGAATFQLNFQWHPVTLRTDGTALTNLTGYQIFQSTSLLTPRSQWVLVTTVTTEGWTTTTDGSVSYYAWKTIDTNGETSDWSQVLDDSGDLNHFFMASDFVSRLQLPGSAAKILLRGNNHYGSDLDISVTEVTADETGRVAKSLQFQITNYDTENEVTDLLFDPPVMRGIIAYSVQNGNVVAGAIRAGALSMPVISAADAAQQLSLFWFNGNEWVKTTGVVNTGDNTMSFTGSRAGRYQIRAASHVSGLTLTRVYPRIITPNGDGWNDKAIFQFDNPQLLPLSGKVYDISDAFVASLAPGPDADTTLEWDGKDSGGKVVPGGIYMYQISVGGTPQSGTVVVAR